jgi:hypothetical protein
MNAQHLSFLFLHTIRKMKAPKMIRLLIIAVMLFGFVDSWAQNPENWTSKQLIEPADLAKDLKANKDLPVIISVGPGAVIPNSVDVGMINNKEGIDKLKKELNNLPKQTKVIVYCGCCPFEHCPNVRPAIDALKEMKFTNYHLLNLQHNIKKDWIDKGFPTSKS